MSEEHMEALDLVSQGDWEGAHQRTQRIHDELSSQIHGYLHREEGDLNNASYWYSRTGQDIANNSLEQELDQLYRLAQPDYSDNY